MKNIKFNEKTKVFTLKTAHTMYQMQVREYGTLVHLYYGADVGECEITDRIIPLDRGFSGNPYEAGNGRTFSLDTLTQEYTGEGNGDYRINGIAVKNEDGSNIVSLEYESYQIKEGKYSLSGLPAMYGSEDEAETLEIVLADKISGLKVVLLYGVFPNLDIITRAVRLEHCGEESVSIEKVMSMELDYPKKDMDLIHFYGRHTMERMTERIPVHHGIQAIGSKRGTSSHQHNPFLILCDQDAGETHGSCYGFCLVYSGNFLGAVEKDQFDQTRIIMGIHPQQFTFCLKKGDVFEAPEVIMAYSDHGLEKLTHIYHDAFRSNLIRSKYVNRPRPILVNNWEATYFDFDETKIYKIAEQAKEIGLDMLVLDDGWFGKRDTDESGLGDWVVNEEKIKGGLKKLVRKVHDLDLKFGLWIEPEMISEDSDLYRNHPEWCLQIPNRLPNRSRYQLNLDISRPEVREYIMNQIFRVMDECRIDYIKWDMNRSLGNIYSAVLGKNGQGEVYHRYVLGVYEMMEKLVNRYPELLFENCSGGGGRFDAGMLYYSPQIWCSDDTDAVERLKIQYGTSFAYPISTMGAHVSVCPNHQTGRSVSFETRGVVASVGTFGYELDLEKMTEDEKAIARKQIRSYKEIEALIQTGDYYRLNNPFQKQPYVFWQFVSKDKKESIVQGILVKCESNGPVSLLYLRGLEAEKQYLEKQSGKIYTGAALMKAGLALPLLAGDYQPLVYHFEMLA